MISYKMIWYFMACLSLVSTSYSCIQSIDPLTDHNSELNEHNQYEWSPVEDYKDLSMLELLEHLSKAAIELGDYKYETSDGWIGFEPATDSLIEDAENRLEVRFPAEYVEFLKITNGFPAVNSIEPSFLPVSKIDYTKNIDPFLISLWGIEGNPDKVNGAKYERSIMIGGLNEEQQFFLIPPAQNSEEWEFWKFASWYPGESVHPTFHIYFENSLAFCEEQIQKN